MNVDVGEGVCSLLAPADSLIAGVDVLCMCSV